LTRIFRPRTGPKRVRSGGGFSRSRSSTTESRGRIPFYRREKPLHISTAGASPIPESDQSLETLSARNDRRHNRVGAECRAIRSAGQFRCRRRNLCVGRRRRCCSRYPGLPQLPILGLARSSGATFAKSGSVVKSAPYHEKNMRGSSPRLPACIRS
jgi:hypothetical protein